MLHGSETWAVTAEDMRKLARNEASMLRWMCNVSVHNRQSVSSLREKLNLRSVSCGVQERRLRWYGHVVRMDEDRCVRKCQSLAVEGTRGRGRPRKTWDEVVKHDLQTLGLTMEMTRDRDLWKYAVREKTRQD